MDRNYIIKITKPPRGGSLSARRAWIEIDIPPNLDADHASLSARRAWIEILVSARQVCLICVALRKESVDRNGLP